MATTFLSPGVYSREQDFTAFAARVGITKLGLVGKTQKGPAFEPIKITSTDDYMLRFGSTDPSLPASYVALNFLNQSNELTVTRILGSDGFTNSGAWVVCAGTGSTLTGASLVVIRSKRNQIDGTFYFDQESDIKIGNITSPLAPFTISATTGPLTALTNSAMTVSLDETREDYIVKQLTKNPKIIDGKQQLYVETIYPHFLREAVSRGEISDLKPSMVYSTNPVYTDYGDSYTNSITPWIVSRVIGTTPTRLFRFQSISDGDASNTEIKISIQNIDIVNYTFDVLVRNFNDTDATASSTALERWANVSLDASQVNFIGRVIGTTNEEYPRKSMFITVDMAESIPTNTVPAGFEGFNLRNSAVSGATNPNIYYKNTYFSGDTVFKTYLGVSELGYTSLTQTQISFRNAVKTLESDLFQYYGGITSGVTQVKGFHMENTADSNYFISGDKSSLTAYTNAAATLIDKNKLKFTVVPVGGFDGWDKYATYEENFEEFEASKTVNIQSFKDGIDTFANAEVTDINLFVTPGIDFANNYELVAYALDTVESRGDSLYIFDSPRITSGDVKGTPEELVSDLESSGLDSNYACTYWPWVQVNDTNLNLYTYQAPTLMVVEAIAFTDNVAQPWFAPAGINRGSANSSIVRADIKLKQAQRDTLYEGRINPIATFIQEGVVIWGQKTIQQRQSALDRVNIRRLLLQVQRLIAAASRTLLFEQNDQTLRDQFLSRVEPILLQIQNQRGLFAFKVVMDDSNNGPTVDRNTLVGKLQLQPENTMEILDLTFQVLPQGADFNLA